MVRRRDHHAVDVFVVEQLAKIVITFRPRAASRERLLEARLIDIRGRYQVRVGFFLEVLHVAGRR